MFARLHPLLSVADLAKFVISQSYALGKSQEVHDFSYPSGFNQICGQKGDSNHMIRVPFPAPLLCGVIGTGLVSYPQNQPTRGIMLVKRYEHWAVSGQYLMNVNQVINYPATFPASQASHNLLYKPSFVPVVPAPLHIPFSMVPILRPQLGSVSSYGASSAPRPRPLPRAKQLHKNAPPPPRTKERKTKGTSAAVKLIMGGVNKTTEFLDALEAIWDALPDDIKETVPKRGRCTGPRCVNHGAPYILPQDKFMAVYRNINSVDVPTALKNLIINHYTDALVGRAHAGADKARQRSGGSGWTFLM